MVHHFFDRASDLAMSGEGVGTGDGSGGRSRLRSTMLPALASQAEDGL